MLRSKLVAPGDPNIYRGPMGPPGPKGEKGTNGSKGIGEKGSKGLGEKGEKGNACSDCRRNMPGVRAQCHLMGPDL